MAFMGRKYMVAVLHVKASISIRQGRLLKGEVYNPLDREAWEGEKVHFTCS